MFLFVPEVFDVPSEKELKDLWLNYESEAAGQAYVDDVGDKMIMSRPEAIAKVIEKKAIKELGGTQYTFENGVKIITKKTDFKKNEIKIYGGSKGGYYYYPEAEVPSGYISINYAWNSGLNGKTKNQLNKIISEKNISFNFGVNATSEYFNAYAKKENLEETLQLIYSVFANPQFTKESWDTLMSANYQVAETYDANPNRVFEDKLNEAIYGKSIFYAPKDKSYLDKMKPEVAEEIFRQRFGNPADFTFVFVGDFNEKQLVNLCANYLGSLKTNDNFEETKYVYFPFPNESKIVNVNKGLDNKGYVYICSGGELAPEADIEKSFKESVIMNQLTSLLDIRLREVIREDNSGTYGVGGGGFIDGWPERYYKIYCGFNCDPAREEELAAAVVDTIKDIQKGNISDENITKIRESYLRSIENSVRDNGWWLNRIIAEVMFTYEPMWFSKDYEKIAKEWITKDNLIEAANKYIDPDRMVTGYLKPEK